MYSGSSPQDSGAAGPRSRWPPREAAPAPGGDAGAQQHAGPSPAAAPQAPHPHRQSPRPAPPPGAPSHAGTCEVRPHGSPGRGGASPLVCPVCPSVGRSTAASATPPEGQVWARGSTDPASLRRPFFPRSPARRGMSSCPAAATPRHLSANPSPARGFTAPTQVSARCRPRARAPGRAGGEVPLSMLGAVVLRGQRIASALGSARSGTPHTSLFSEPRPGPPADGVGHRSPSKPIFSSAIPTGLRLPCSPRSSGQYGVDQRLG